MLSTAGNLLLISTRRLGALAPDGDEDLILLLTLVEPILIEEDLLLSNNDEPLFLWLTELAL